MKIRSHRQPGSLALGHQDFSTSQMHHGAVISPPRHLQVRRAQRIKAHFRKKRLVAGDADMLEHAGRLRVGDDLFDNAITPGRVGIGAPVTESVFR